MRLQGFENKKHTHVFKRWGKKKKYKNGKKKLKNIDGLYPGKSCIAILGNI